MTEAEIHALLDPRDIEAARETARSLGPLTPDAASTIRTLLLPEVRKQRQQVADAA